MASGEAAATSLPEIPLAKHGLVESGRRAPVRGAGLSDSGLDLQDSTASIRSGSAGAARSPPIRLARSSPQPLSPRPPSPMRPHPGEYVRVSRAELERREQSLAVLRSETARLQAQVRQLEGVREDSTTLTETCSKLAQVLDCSLVGVAAESVHDILSTRLAGRLEEHQTALTQLAGARSELERVRSEAAVANVRVSSLEAHLHNSRGCLASSQEQLAKTREELDVLRQSKARIQAGVQSLQSQLAESERSRKGVEPQSTLTSLQTEMGKMRKEIKEKDEAVGCLEARLASGSEEQEGALERAEAAEAAYEELCLRLASALQLPSAEEPPSEEDLVSQACSVVEEYQEVKMKLDTMARTLKTAELDSKANKEAIQKLVGQLKKTEGGRAEVAQLQQAQAELHETLAEVEQERDSLQERLLAAKETLSAQNRELQSKEDRLSDLTSTLAGLKWTTAEENAALQQQQAKVEEFCCSVGGLLGCAEPLDFAQLLESLRLLRERTVDLERREHSCSTQLERLGAEHARTVDELREAGAALDQERSKMRQLQGEAMTLDLVREGLGREVDKFKSFLKRLSKTLLLDSATAEIISGEFAADAILTRSEQLAQQETQALAEKQSAVYCLQRKLKASRQSLGNKELHIGLLQKKIVSLEDRLSTYSRREADWEGAADKTRRLEKQLEHVSKRVGEHKGTISRLEGECAELERLKHHCTAQEERLVQAAATLERLQQEKVQQERDVREVHHQAQASRSREGGELERARDELGRVQTALEHSRENEQKLTAFRSAVQRLLSDGENPADYDLIATLEGVVASQRHHKERVQSLEHSLRQLETDFRASYSDTMTLLQSES